METLQAERRALTRSLLSHPASVDAEQAVRHAIALQASVGTLGAVEYLKARRIEATVIARVLSDSAVRAEDLISRDQPVAWE
ncbi:hypothetical protein LK542_08905 [Massilia sp. IC2-477]|uniref:hypothetical protein n=1 Tax=Massilia sp. IC2-477 TaxID=2887198 RepID=UPI001D1235F5|nr:hypothetical protein [Massilia sp. IC2-477]MCC2955732.1 hypothetical protein [Massilia sp. IC2-477]